MKYRLSVSDLLRELEDWDKHLKRKVLVVACGGTALTLKGYKESTKDVDFMVPIENQYAHLTKTLNSLRYEFLGNADWKHPNGRYIFQLWGGQTLFYTSLLEPVSESHMHSVHVSMKRLTLAMLNSHDLIISKMFRGDLVDEEDSALLIKSESIDLVALVERYIETAAFQINPEKCKLNLKYLLTRLDDTGIETSALWSRYKEWIP
ncbi:MAG TPA: DUF6036 family nucleotidyltransferase [Planktothrix sp.]